MMKKLMTITLTLGVLLSGILACSNNEVVNKANASNQLGQNNVAEEVDPVVLEAVTEKVSSNSAAKSYDGKVRKINTETFIEEIFDYKANPQAWVYKGDKPAVIDFYADWCGPCKRVAPILDELAIKYKGQVNFYKIDTDDEKELSGRVFGIRSIPSILYIPVEGQPTMAAGLMSKEDYIKTIEETIL